jgi:hypothetical protein
LIAKVIVGFFMFGLRINNMCRVKADVFLLSLVAASFSLRYVLVDCRLKPAATFLFINFIAL